MSGERRPEPSDPVVIRRGAWRDRRGIYLCDLNPFGGNGHQIQLVKLDDGQTVRVRSAVKADSTDSPQREEQA